MHNYLTAVLMLQFTAQTAVRALASDYLNCILWEGEDSMFPSYTHYISDLKESELKIVHNIWAISNAIYLFHEIISISIINDNNIFVWHNIIKNTDPGG